MDTGIACGEGEILTGNGNSCKGFGGGFCFHLALAPAFNEDLAFEPVIHVNSKRCDLVGFNAGSKAIFLRRYGVFIEQN